MPRVHLNPWRSLNCFQYGRTSLDSSTFQFPWIDEVFSRSELWSRLIPRNGMSSRDAKTVSTKGWLLDMSHAQAGKT